MKKITAADGASGDNFGHAIAIDGDTIIVGADEDNDLGADSGSVYVFTRSGTNWVQSRKITPADGAAGDHFGWSVALSGDTLVAGASSRNQSGTDSGAAYVFSRHQGGSNQWGLVKKLLPGDPGANDDFGYAVAVDRDTIVVGAPFNDDLGTDSGAAYIFARHQGGSNQWGQVKKLLPGTGGSSSDNFGRAVGVDGDNIVVGAPEDNAVATDSGSAYLFNRNAGGTNQWNGTERFVPGTSSENGKFGYALAVSHSTLVVGAPFEQPGGPKTGTIYIYRLKYNNPPMLFSPIPDQYVAPDVPFSFVLPPGTFTDPDIRESLVLSTGPLPAWVSFDPLTGTFSGLPTTANLGNYPITVSATDEDQQSVSDVFAIAVATPLVNRPPVAHDDGGVTTKNQAVVISAFGVLANDSDDDLDLITIAGVNATSTNGASVAWSGGDITYTPVLNFTGTDRFSYTITDGRGAIATAKVEVLVASAPLPAADQLSMQSLPEGRVLLFRGTPGQTYYLERSSNLRDWTPILTNSPLHGIIQYVETNGPATGGFYRVFKR